MKLPLRALCLALLCATTSAALAAPTPSPRTAAKAAHRTTKTAPAAAAVGATLPPSGAPFWTGTPNAAGFARRENARLVRARAAIARLLAVKGPRTLENTLRPYDDAEMELADMVNEASVLEQAHPDSAMRDSAETAEQRGVSYLTEISLNRKVYDGIRAIHVATADAETRYYVERTLKEFHLAGVDKDDATRARIKSLTDDVVKIGQEFSHNVRAEQPKVSIASNETDGLPADFVAAHKPEADGHIVVLGNEAEYFPVLTYAKNPDVRRRMWVAFNNRGYPRNMAVLDSLFVKNYDIATLVGYPNWADYHTADKMVGSAKDVRAFIDKIVAASGDRAALETQTLLERKRKDIPGATTLDVWDRFYYPEAVRRERYNFDSQVLRPYFPFKQVRQGVLDIASRMFGVTFRPVPNAPVWHPSVECFEMLEGGKLIGRFYLDMHPRANKYEHAAEFTIHTGVEGRQIPEAALLCNLPGGDPNDPGLCEMDDVNTMFHEFGHLLHELFSGHHRWEGIGGISTERDFVEAPSQMLEEWMRDPKVLRTFARHYQTGAVIPDSLLAAKKRADSFAEGGQGTRGLYVRRQMVLADLSLSVYDRPPSEVNTDTLMTKISRAYLPYPIVPAAHQQCAFGHLVGYTAGYYTYMWSEVIAKDMFSAFNHDDLLDPKVAKRYRDTVISQGGSAPAAKLVENFLGRPFNFDAYHAWLEQPVIP